MDPTRDWSIEYGLYNQELVDLGFQNTGIFLSLIDE